MRLILPLLLATCCLAQDGMPELPAPALAAGAAEAVLPQGAVLHVRVAGLGQVLDSLDRLIVPFVPAKALPPDLQPFLEEPRPLLAFLGAQSVGQPLTPALIGQVTGIAADRPLSLTFYPAAPDEGFVLALPIADRAALTGLLLNLTAAIAMEPIDLGGRPALHILCGNPDLPRQVVALTSPDTLYVCGSPELAAQIAGAAGQPVLGRSSAVAKALADHAKADVAVVFDAALLKGLLPLARQQYATIPPEVIADARRALAEMEPPVRAQLDLRLRLQLGIGLDQLVDLGECLATATWETLFAALARQIAALDGLAVAVDLGERDQRATLTLYSAEIDPARWTRAIPRPAALAGLALLPGEREMVALHGQDPAPVRSEFAQAWVANLTAKMVAKKLPAAWAQRLAAYAAAQAEAPTLASRVPWSAETEVLTVPAPKPAAAQALGAWLADIATWLGRGAPSRVAILPGTDGALLERHLREVAQIAAANATAWTALSEPIFGAPFADRVHRVRSEPAAKNGVGTLVSEDAWITRNGFLGWDQHELVCRTFVRWRAQAGHLLVQHGAPDPAWLAAVPPQPRALPPALTELLALPPADASTIVAGRQLQRVVEAVDLLVEVEALARRELDAYLAQAKALTQKHRDPAALATALAGLDMPLLVVALERGRDGQLGCRLVGDLRYPRPAVLPLVRGLFQEYAAKAPTLGGGIAWQRVSAGRAEWTLVQRTDALATLVRTVGDAVWGSYLNDRQGQQTLERTLSVRGDGRRRNGEVLAFNPLWAFLE